MADSTQKTLMTGVALIVAVLFGIVGMQVLAPANVNTVIDADTNAEWNAFIEDTNSDGTTISANYVIENDEFSIAQDNTSGYIYSQNLTDEQLTPENVTVDATLPDADNSSITLAFTDESGLNTVNTVQLTSGENEVAIPDGTERISLSLTRDAATIESPSVQSIFAQYTETSLLYLVGGAAFGLLVLMMVVQELGMGLSRRR